MSGRMQAVRCCRDKASLLNRELQIDRRYLILPVRRRPATGIPRQAAGHVRLRAGGEVVRHFDIDLADGAKGMPLPAEAASETRGCG